MEPINYSTTQSFWILTMNLGKNKQHHDENAVFPSSNVSTPYKHCDSLPHKLQFTNVCLNSINIHPVSGEMVFSWKTIPGMLLTVLMHTPARPASQTSSCASLSQHPENQKDFHTENKELMDKLPLQTLQKMVVNASWKL